MTRDEIRATLASVLQRVAPEVDPQALRGDLPLRDQIDLDSMDVLNVMIGLSERLGIEVPEADYGEFSTLDEAVNYLVRALEVRGTMDSATS
jgi:acyl carrier protein